ncbi:hypothetical protein Mth01_36000 [Sphaerimonospora thailandensis]|uniref:Uncharacterized protein n=1 Tax=Sphaerimonospora thailandensis TaxID=795644 RepID=A0A8J3R912_9ACTN|nr:hypothetical protein Mth01_36000 [Sphaerimonospora thailandensis]
MERPGNASRIRVIRSTIDGGSSRCAGAGDSDMTLAAVIAPPKLKRILVLECSNETRRREAPSKHPKCY